VKCVVCRNGETQPGKTTITLERGGTMLVVRGVPARVCDNCGEEYVDGEAAGLLLRVAEEAVKAGVRVDVLEYLAA